MSIHIAPLEDEPTPAPDAGCGALMTDKGNLPLDEIDVRAVITGVVAGVEVVQGFRNPFDVALEATYIFPLPDRAAVTAMRMEAADRVIEGVLKERASARREYDAAIAQGRRAAIAEEDRPDVFTMRVGNIAPGEHVVVRLSLNQPLPYSDGQVTFRFPLVVAPRYIPGSPAGGTPSGAGVAADTDAVPDASRISPPVLLPGFPNPVRLTVRADIHPGGLPLTAIRSSLHAVADDADPDGSVTVRLHPGERVNRDVILRMEVADEEHAAASLTLTPDPAPAEQGAAEGRTAEGRTAEGRTAEGRTAEGRTAEGRSAEGTFVLTVLPPTGGTAQRPRDVVLLLDRSGSMTGWKMVAARRAAARIVDTLTVADRFMVVCFDNQIELPPDLPDALVTATDRHRFRAVEYLARMSAWGGTEMLAPLEHAVAVLSGTGTDAETDTGTDRDRVLVLVTDGQVGNEDQILQRIGSRLSGIRVHVVGIDRAVNAGFLNRLAVIGRGRCELVESEDRLDDAATQIHRRIGAPLVTGLELHPDGLDMVPGTVAPAAGCDLFPGAALTIAGRWRGSPGGGITVRGTTADGGPFEQRISVTVSAHPASTAIWARAHLRDLEDRYEVGPVPGAGDWKEYLSSLERRIVEVSLRFGVLCRFTAFLAADTRVVTDGDAPHQVIQPVELPAGWEEQAEQMVGFASRAIASPQPLGGRAEPRYRGITAPPMAKVAGSVERYLIADEAAEETEETGALALDQARQQIVDEIAGLDAAGSRTELERRRLLADLASRLDALVWHLTGEGVAEEFLTDLVKLAAELRTCDAPTGPRGDRLAALWDWTGDVLTGFAEARSSAPPGSAEPPSQPSPQRTFWKRHT